MGFFQSSFRARLPLRTCAPIFAVGRRVYVASPDCEAGLTLTDDAGADAAPRLADGTEVEILAWRPRSSGTRYRVRSTRAGLEGWLPAGSLRSARSAISPPPLGPTSPGPTAARIRREPSGVPTRRLRKRSA